MFFRQKKSKTFNNLEKEEAAKPMLKNIIHAGNCFQN